MRVVVIHCKLNTACGLTGWGENVDVGEIAREMLANADLMPVDL